MTTSVMRANVRDRLEVGEEGQGKYAITTPVRPDITWPIEHFLRGVRQLDPQPEVVAVITTEDVFDIFFKDEPLFELIDDHPPMDLNRLLRIGIARDRLQKWFVQEREEEFQFWLDADIEVTVPDAMRRLSRPIQEGQAKVVSAGYRARWSEDSTVYALGCTMVHRHVADLGVHHCPALGGQGKEYRLSAAQMYSVCMEANSRRLQKLYDVPRLWLKTKEIIQPIHHVREGEW